MHLMVNVITCKLAYFKEKIVNNVRFRCAHMCVERPQVAMQQYSLSPFQMKFIMSHNILNDMPQNM